MALKQINRQAHQGHDPRLGRGVPHLLPDPVDVLTSFKSELDAIAMPPKFLFFNWTLENYAEVQERSNYLHFAFNSIVLSIGANIVGLLIAVPAAWSMAFAPGQAHQGPLDVDAVDQDDARGRRAGADLPPVPRTCICSTACLGSASC